MRRINVVFICICAFTAFGALGFGGSLEQVSLDASTPHADLFSAWAAVDTGGVIEFTQAGNDPGDGTFPDDGKIVPIRGAVPGLIIGGPTQDGSLNLNNPLTTDGTDFRTQNINITLDNLTILRGTGTGAVFDIDLAAGISIDITMKDVTVTHLGAPAGGYGMRIDDGFAGAGPLTVTATDCVFESLATSDNERASFRVGSDGDPKNDLTFTFTNCTFTHNADATIRTDAIDNQHWTFTNCTMTSTKNRCFEVDDPHNNSSFTFVDTTMTGYTEVVRVNEGGCTGNSWVFKRCTIDNSPGTRTTGAETDPDRIANRTMYMSYGSDSVGRGTNTFELYNCLVIAMLGDGADGNNRALYLRNYSDGAIYHNTFVAAGTGGTAPTGDRGISFGTNSVAHFRNNIFYNFSNAIDGSTVDIETDAGLVSLTKTGNMIAGETDDGSAGADRIFVSIADAMLDPVTYKPLEGGATAPGSPALEAGDPAAAIAAAVEFMDREKLDRPRPDGTNPDIGAYEIGPLGPVGPALEVTPSSGILDFGTRQVGTASSPKQIILSNVNGTESLSLSNFVLSGDHTGDFLVNPSSNIVLLAGESLTVDVIFTPGANGPRSATLQVDHNDDVDVPSPVTIGLTGAGADTNPTAVDDRMWILYR